MRPQKLGIDSIPPFGSLFSLEEFGFWISSSKIEITLSQPLENPDLKNPDSGFCHSLSNIIHTAKTVNVVKSKAVGVIY